MRHELYVRPLGWATGPDFSQGGGPCPLENASELSEVRNGGSTEKLEARLRMAREMNPRAHH